MELSPNQQLLQNILDLHKEVRDKRNDWHIKQGMEPPGDLKEHELPYWGE